MPQPSSDPRAPFVIGIVILGVLLLGGMVWAILSAPSAPSGAAGEDANLSFSDANDPALGPEDAPVTVRIFGDLECPACKAAEPGVTHLRRDYADTVRLVWNDFPLPPTVHPHAREAANAARCAEEQGKFWEMHDALYDAQASWASSRNLTEDFVALGRKIGLDEDAFRACYGEKRYDGKVTDDMSEGRANAVDSTPTFFVNNTRVVGVRSSADWDQILAPFVQNASQAPAESTVPASSEGGDIQLQL